MEDEAAQVKENKTQISDGLTSDPMVTLYTRQMNYSLKKIYTFRQLH